MLLAQLRPVRFLETALDNQFSLLLAGASSNFVGGNGAFRM